MSPDLLLQRPLIENYLGKTSLQHSACSFVSIAIWQDFFQFDVKEIDRHLCIFASDAAGTFLYLPPLAEVIKSSVIEQCFKMMGKGVARIENVGEEQLKFFSKEKYQIYKKGEEYLYRRADLADLKGGALKSKRNVVNHFIKHFQGEYSPFETSMAKECADLYNRWAKEKATTIQDDIFSMMIEDSRLVHRRIFADFHVLGLVGRIVKVGGKICAYTFGYFLNNETFCDLAEIADPQIKEVAGYIFWQLCNDPVLQKTQFINVMDDFVPEDVNRAKISYRPSAMLPLYTISLR